jgi:hypothetical protein
MEIITCGAVPPYGEILGGKLVAMLLAAPRGAADFAERYENRASLIPSGIAGRPMRRHARLTVLTTSSLYSLGSSQYNRVRVPAEPFGREGRVAYERIGVSESYGHGPLRSRHCAVARRTRAPDAREPPHRQQPVRRGDES